MEIRELYWAPSEHEYRKLHIWQNTAQDEVDGIGRAGTWGYEWVGRFTGNELESEADARAAAMRDALAQWPGIAFAKKVERF